MKVEVESEHEDQQLVVLSTVIESLVAVDQSRWN